MTTLDYDWLSSSSQNFSNSKNMELDSTSMTTKILEIPTINTDREKPLNTHTNYFLSKKISVENTPP